MGMFSSDENWETIQAEFRAEFSGTILKELMRDPTIADRARSIRATQWPATANIPKEFQEAFDSRVPEKNRYDDLATLKKVLTQYLTLNRSDSAGLALRSQMSVLLERLS